MTTIEKLIGKSFMVDREKWILEEILPYGHICICRNTHLNTTEKFNNDFVKDRILSKLSTENHSYD